MFSTRSSPSPQDRARSYIEKIPGAISGQAGHAQTFKLACALVHGFALPELQAFRLLQDYNRRCEPPWTERELWHTVQSATKANHAKPRGYLLGSGAPSAPRRAGSPGHAVETDRKLDAASAVDVYLAGKRCREADLWEASPVRLSQDWRNDFELILETLYRDGDLINYVTDFRTDESGKPLKARPAGLGATLERGALIDHCRNHGPPQSEAGAWLRMNPVDGGGVGDANVTDYRYALIENDSIPLNLQVSLLGRLPLPIAAILASGGRSLHAWVHVKAGTLEEYKANTAWLLDALASFGIDGKNKNPSRLSRLPGAQRRIGQQGDGRQYLLYLNPNPKNQSIL